MINTQTNTSTNNPSANSTPNKKTRPANKRQTRLLDKTLRITLYVVLLLVASVYLLPFLVMLITSLKDVEEIRSGTLLSLPNALRFDAWSKAWSSACTGSSCEGIAPFFVNSFQIVLPAVAISTILGALNGYVISMWKFRGSNLFFAALLIGCFIPFQVILLPMAQTLGWLGIANTTSGLVFVHVVYGIAFTTLFFRNFYQSIPGELVKAARLDGAGFFHYFSSDYFAGLHPHYCGYGDLAVYANLE